MICVCKDSKVNFMLLGEAGGAGGGGGVIFSYWGEGLVGGGVGGLHLVTKILIFRSTRN